MEHIVNSSALMTTIFIHDNMDIQDFDVECLKVIFTNIDHV